MHLRQLWLWWGRVIPMRLYNRLILMAGSGQTLPACNQAAHTSF